MKLIKKLLLFMTLFLFVFLIITGIIPFLNFKLQKSSIVKRDKPVLSIAHRGASEKAPENTLIAFKKAMDDHADIIELDLHLSKDDSLIVIHDYNTKRTTGFDGNIENLTFNQIKELNASYDFKDIFPEEKIPTLDEVLKLVNGKHKVLIELKWPRNGVYPNLVKKTLECVKRNNAEDWVILQSFETSYIKEIISLNKKIECHQLIFGASNILPIYYDRTIRFGNFEPIEGISSVNIFYLYANNKFVKKMNKKGIKVFVFTVDDKKNINRAINFGVEGIISNNPAIVNMD